MTCRGTAGFSLPHAGLHSHRLHEVGRAILLGQVDNKPVGNMIYGQTLTKYNKSKKKLLIQQMGIFKIMV